MFPGEAPFPNRFQWVSERLSREILEIPDAVRNDVSLTDVSVSSPQIPFVPSVQLNFERKSHKNATANAVRATRAVASRTGSLEHPNEYIRLTLRHAWIASLEIPFAWKGGMQHPLATIFADEWVEGVGRVYVALFGSQANISAEYQIREHRTGRPPSDVIGLYRILDRMREPSDPPIHGNLLTDELYNPQDPAVIVDHVIPLIESLANPLPAQPLEILAEPFCMVRNHIIRHKTPPITPDGPYDLILIGAPVWAGTPAAGIDTGVQRADSTHIPVEWTNLNDQLHEYLSVLRSGGNPETPEICLSLDKSLWQMYTKWFINMGQQRNKSLSELYTYRHPPKWQLIDYFLGRREDRTLYPSNIKGLVVPTSSPALMIPSSSYREDLCLITDQGEAISVRMMRETIIYSPGNGSDEYLDRRADPATLDSQDLGLVKQAMWYQAVSWIKSAN